MGIPQVIKAPHGQFERTTDIETILKKKTEIRRLLTIQAEWLFRCLVRCHKCKRSVFCTCKARREHLRHSTLVPVVDAKRAYLRYSRVTLS